MNTIYYLIGCVLIAFFSAWIIDFFLIPIVYIGIFLLIISPIIDSIMKKRGFIGIFNNFDFKKSLTINKNNFSGFLISGIIIGILSKKLSLVIGKAVIFSLFIIALTISVCFIKNEFCKIIKNIKNFIKNFLINIQVFYKIIKGE